MGIWGKMPNLSHFLALKTSPSINLWYCCLSLPKCLPWFLLQRSLNLCQCPAPFCRWQWNSLSFEFAIVTFSSDWALAVMISVSPPCMPMVGHNSLYSPWNLHWEHLSARPRDNNAGSRAHSQPARLFTFLWAWPSPCYWGKCRPSNKTIYDPG